MPEAPVGSKGPVLPPSVELRVPLRHRLPVLAAALVVALSACGVLPPAAPPAQVPRSAQAPVSDGSEMSNDERLAVLAADAFWRRRFPDLSSAQYQPPNVVGRYSGTNGPACGGQLSIPFNAVYCPAGDFVAWDVELMATGFERIGDAWVYLIIMHEWGHAVQARLDRNLVSVAAELQADCFAGATLQGSVADRVIALDDGDVKELQSTLITVADEFPWTDISDHGDATQRITAFNRGTRGGVDACT